MCLSSLSSCPCIVETYCETFFHGCRIRTLASKAHQFTCATRRRRNLWKLRWDIQECVPFLLHKRTYHVFKLTMFLQCPAEMQAAISNHSKYPILIIQLDTEGYPDQVMVQVQGVVITGSSNLKDGSMYLLLAYLIFGIPLAGRSQLLRLLQAYLLGSQSDKELKSLKRPTKTFYGVLRQLGQTASCT